MNTLTRPPAVCAGVMRRADNADPKGALIIHAISAKPGIKFVFFHNSGTILT